MNNTFLSQKGKENLEKILSKQLLRNVNFQYSKALQKSWCTSSVKILESRLLDKDRTSYEQHMRPPSSDVLSEEPDA
ncbi:hypothetical protein [Celeribacter ethanolicus]|uniref:hypothetical protein n=1 Tax=Celeribacter ethanolicus TaxID=1758178 RepID=UPI00138F776E|nr:hypothetical protein [Celeribacter ethanolicus]